MSVQRSWDRKRRQVKERVINVAKVTGKCGISFRGHCNKAAYDLENTAVNHGNFMELLLLLSKRDVSYKSMTMLMFSCVKRRGEEKRIKRLKLFREKRPSRSFQKRLQLISTGNR